MGDIVRNFGRTILAMNEEASERPVVNNAANSPFFHRLNYDIRYMIYSHITPIMTHDDAWKGLALSCRQAYSELAEIAARKVQKHINECLETCEQKTGYKPKLLDTIDVRGGIGPLRSVVLILSKTALLNTTRSFHFAPGAWDFWFQQEPPMFSEHFVENVVIMALRPIFAKFFSKVTIYIPDANIKHGAVPAEFLEPGLENMGLWAISQKWHLFHERIGSPYDGRVWHLLWTIYLLAEASNYSISSRIPGTPSERLLTVNPEPVNTKFIGIAWNGKNRGWPQLPPMTGISLSATEECLRRVREESNAGAEWPGIYRLMDPHQSDGLDSDLALDYSGEVGIHQRSSWGKEQSESHSHESFTRLRCGCLGEVPALVLEGESASRREKLSWDEAISKDEDVN